MLLLLFAFLSGLLTILAPCIWPLLPIVLSASASGKSHKRPLGVVIGIMLSFAFFTLFISFLIRLFHLDPNLLRLLAVLVLVVFGLSMLVPSFSRFLELFVSRLAGKFGGKGVAGGDFSAGFLTGLSLGIVWSPCAGPILATIATLSATGRISSSLILVTIAYVLGVGIPLFMFAYAGQKLFKKTRFVTAYTGRVQQVFGLIMLLTAGLIFTNYDKVLEAKLLTIFPAFSVALNGFETNNAVTSQLSRLKGSQVQTTSSDLLNTNYQAPELTGVSKWLNTAKPLSINSLRGKVVLIDFWTYTCINCIRTLPHVTSWYDKYKDKGLVIIGVHTPEFAFEHETANVQQALEQYNIHYPVAQDNSYQTWNAFNNQYWPAEYLIDAKGNVRRTHFGEGEYDLSEQAIQALLKEAGKTVSTKLDTMPDQTPHAQISPETYLGSARVQFYYPSSKLGNGEQTFTAENPPSNAFSFGGKWQINDEYAQTKDNAVLVYHFTANKVHLVLKKGSDRGEIKVFLDDKQVTKQQAGSDVTSGSVTVDEDRLYNLIDLRGKTEEHTLRLELTPGVQTFAFTFS